MLEFMSPAGGVNPSSGVSGSEEQAQTLNFRGGSVSLGGSGVSPWLIVAGALVALYVMRR